MSTNHINDDFKNKNDKQFYTKHKKMNNKQKCKYCEKYFDKGMSVCPNCRRRVNIPYLEIICVFIFSVFILIFSVLFLIFKFISTIDNY